MVKKSVELNVDSIIFDLEDAVPPEDKERARELLSKMLKELDWGRKELYVRINSLQLLDPYLDISFVSMEDKISCIVVPKAENDLSFLYKATGKNLIPLIETAKGVLKLKTLCALKELLA